MTTGHDTQNGDSIIGPDSSHDADSVHEGRELIDANAYLTLATADADGRPWASPVWFAHEDYRDFFWLSRPEARHSRNLAARRELAIVLFDSTVPAGTGRAVYIEADGAEVTGDDLDRAITIYSARSEAHGVGA